MTHNLTPRTKMYMGIKANGWEITQYFNGAPMITYNVSPFYDTHVVIYSKNTDDNGKSSVLLRCNAGLQVPGFNGKSVGGVLLGYLEKQIKFSYEPTDEELFEYGINEMLIPAVEKVMSDLGSIKLPVYKA